MFTNRSELSNSQVGRPSLPKPATDACRFPCLKGRGEVDLDELIGKPQLRDS